MCSALHSWGISKSSSPICASTMRATFCKKRSSRSSGLDLTNFKNLSNPAYRSCKRRRSSVGFFQMHEQFFPVRKAWANRHPRHASNLGYYGLLVKLAVNRMMGTWLVRQFKMRHTSKPSISGIITSLMTRSGTRRKTAATPSLPFRALVNLIIRREQEGNVTHHVGVVFDEQQARAVLEIGNWKLGAAAASGSRFIS